MEGISRGGRLGPPVGRGCIEATKLLGFAQEKTIVFRVQGKPHGVKMQGPARGRGAGAGQPHRRSAHAEWLLRVISGHDVTALLRPNVTCRQPNLLRGHLDTELGWSMLDASSSLFGPWSLGDWRCSNGLPEQTCAPMRANPSDFKLRGNAQVF